MKRWALLFALFALMHLSSGCSDGRPSEAAVKTDMERRYPGTEVLSVSTQMDEVVARSFRLKYRKAGDRNTKEIEIQFMKDESTKKWIPSPAPTQL
jgi:hypothetical protein